MHIVFIQHASSAGGSVISLGLLLRGLERLPVRRTVVLLYPNEELIRFYGNLCEEVVCLPGARFPHTTGFSFRFLNPLHWLLGLQWLIQFLKSTGPLRELLNRLNPDVVHLNSVTLIPYLPFLQNRPSVVHVRELVVHGILGLRRAILAALSRRANTSFIYICRDYRTHFAFPALCAATILNPVVGLGQNTKPLPPALIERLAAWRRESPETPIALFLGGLSYIKGAEFFARAWHKAGEGRCRLIIGGQTEASNHGLLFRAASYLASLLPFSESSSRARRLFRRYRSNPDIYFAGFVDNPDELMRRTDVTLVPFTEPHFARPVLEAGSVGCRTIVSNICGLTCLLEDGIATYGFEVGNIDSFSDAVTRFIEDWSQTRAQLPPTIPEGLSPESHAQTVYGFLQQVVAKFRAA